MSELEINREINRDDDSTQDDEEVTLKRVAQHLCDYCRKDISQSIRIKCCQCADFMLCVYCFADGVELNIDEQNSHLRTHPYRVIDRINAPIFDEEWTADDELMLLEGLERYGMGNWQEIANHIGSKSKSKSKIEQHYCGVYLNCKTNPLPDPTVILNPSLYVKDPTNYGLVTSDGNTMTPDVTIQSAPTTKRKLTADAQAAGYRPKRRDFDTEFDNGAEELLNDCTLHDHKDDAVKLRLTYKMLDVFNRKLDERVERKKFLIDRGLLWVRSHSKYKHNREFKAFYQQAKVFNRFFPSDDEFIEFVEDLHRERVLVRDVAELFEHRRNGIRTFQEEFVFKEQFALREALGSTAESQDTDCSPTRIASGSRAELAASLANDLLRRRPFIPENCIASPDGFDISNMECVELLDLEERSICTKFHMLPRHFNMLKQKIFLQSYSQGYLTLKDAVQCCEPLDPNVTTQLYNLFVKRGLINSTPPSIPIATLPAYDPSLQRNLQHYGKPPLPKAKKPKIKTEPQTPISGL